MNFFTTRVFNDYFCVLLLLCVHSKTKPSFWPYFRLFIEFPTCFINNLVAVKACQPDVEVDDERVVLDDLDKDLQSDAQKFSEVTR